MRLFSILASISLSSVLGVVRDTFTAINQDVNGLGEESTEREETSHFLRKEIKKPSVSKTKDD